MVISLLNDCLCFAAVAYFPASGLRREINGAFLNVGFEGDSWSSSSCGFSDVYGARLYFDLSLMFPSGGIIRAFCFPVRCVQELASILYHLGGLFKDVIRTA